MGIRIRTNVDASAYATKFSTAVTRGLKIIALLDTSSSKLETNFSTTSNDRPTIVGSPIISNDGARFTALSSFLETEIEEPDDFSFAAISRTIYSHQDVTASGNADHCATIFGNYEDNLSGIYIGNILYTNGIQIYGISTTVSNQYVAFDSSTPTNTWRLVRGSYKNSTNFFTVTDETLNKNTSKTFSGNIKKSTKKIRIGSQFGAAWKGPIEISQIRFADVVWTDDEFASVVSEMRRYELLHNNRTV
jgi:hypothetical protein